MKKSITVVGVLVSLFTFSCAEKDTTFLITENSIGSLTNTSEIDALTTIFSQDSIIRDTTSSKIGATAKKIQVFEKGGAPLLLLTPSADSVQTVENIQILDPRYLAENGIGLKSTFKDIQANYTIKKVVTMLNSVVVFPKESNLYFTIDKGELPSNLRYTSTNIEAVQIPDEAKIKYLMLGWD